jgi:hypothetical protein
MKSKQMSCTKSQIGMTNVAKLIGLVEGLHKQQQDRIKQMKQISGNSADQTLIFEAEGFQEGYGIPLRMLHKITPEMDLSLAFKGIVSFLEGNIYVESGDLIDGDKNGLPVNEPQYFYNLRGKCYAFADVSNLISEELERISPTGNAS